METVRVLTEERVILMREEGEKFMLGDQLKSYSISNTLANGALSFKSNATDHTLDAFCMAIYGLLERTENILDKGNILTNINSGNNVVILNGIENSIDKIVNSMIDISPDLDGNALYNELSTSWFNNIKVVQRSKIESPLSSDNSRSRFSSKRNRL